MEIRSVGVVGAGQMGAGIAQVFAQAGYSVLLNDISADALQAASAGIAGALDRQVEKGRMTPEEHKAVMDRLALETDLTRLGPCDLIVESATEKEAVKVEIFKTLLPHLSEGTILTTNTSSISITRLASTTDRPERFMGLHFMNPVPVMALVELIRGIATDDATFQTMKGVVDKLGKTAAVAEDFPAFIVNRILLPMINEAIYTLYEGVGTVESIDTAMKLGTRHPMGPLELAGPGQAPRFRPTRAVPTATWRCCGLRPACRDPGSGRAAA
jgi:3-hydroxybutyryl-CoA dehydrogenase